MAAAVTVECGDFLEFQVIIILHILKFRSYMLLSMKYIMSVMCLRSCKLKVQSPFDLTYITASPFYRITIKEYRYFKLNA